MTSDPARPRTSGYNPLTFCERGVVVPFTTPMLAGARARIAPAMEVELIVPNPSGAAGLYILSWAGARRLCRPTVHDTRLHSLLSTHRHLTPGVVQGIARKVALEGLAGREAKDAAEAAVKRDEDAAREARFRLACAFVQQSGAEALPGDVGASAEGEERLAQLVAKFATERHFTPAWTRTALDELGRVFAKIGSHQTEPPARLPRLVSEIVRLRAEVAGWASERLDESVPTGEAIAALAGETADRATILLRQAHGAADNAAALLSLWAERPGQVEELAERAAWLLDGWDGICVLWGAAEGDAARRRVLREIAGLLPMIPREAASWTGVASAATQRGGRPRIVRLNADWRTGDVFERIARNEWLRAALA